MWDTGIYLTDETAMIFAYDEKNYAFGKYRNAFLRIN